MIPRFKEECNDYDLFENANVRYGMLAAFCMLKRSDQDSDPYTGGYVVGISTDFKRILRELLVETFDVECIDSDDSDNSNSKEVASELNDFNNISSTKDLKDLFNKKLTCNGIHKWNITSGDEYIEWRIESGTELRIYKIELLNSEINVACRYDKCPDF